MSAFPSTFKQCLQLNYFYAALNDEMLIHTKVLTLACVVLLALTFVKIFKVADHLHTCSDLGLLLFIIHLQKKVLFRTQSVHEGHFTVLH
jgi:hypothetical protein